MTSKRKPRTTDLHGCSTSHYFIRHTDLSSDPIYSILSRERQDGCDWLASRRCWLRLDRSTCRRLWSIVYLIGFVTISTALYKVLYIIFVSFFNAYRQFYFFWVLNWERNTMKQIIFISFYFLCLCFKKCIYNGEIECFVGLSYIDCP
jgi:hypothetical protein